MNLYDFTVRDGHGGEKALADFRDKVVLVVNTASQCGFTPQLGPLQDLYKAYRDQGFVVLAFPSNQFGGQEPDTDENIRKFYNENFGVEFPIMAKCDVNGPDAIPLYVWLKEQKGGRTGRAIKWNFTKFLINRRGEVVARHASSFAPVKLKAEIEKLLQEKA